MANKIKSKLILELREAQMSQRMIAETRHMSRSSVSDVFRIAKEKNIRYMDVQGMSEEEVYQLFFPDKYTDLGQLYELPDYSSVHTELKRIGVTLKLLWQEYSKECQNHGTVPVGYSKY